MTNGVCGGACAGNGHSSFVILSETAMDAPTPNVPAYRVNSFLPYAAVFSADVRSTLRSWIYRLWTFLSFATVAGFLLYRFGAKNVGTLQPAPELIHDLITWIIW